MPFASDTSDENGIEYWATILGGIELIQISTNMFFHIFMLGKEVGEKDNVS